MVASTEIARNPSTNFGNLFHRNVVLSPIACGAAAAHPVERVAEHHEPDRRVARRLGEHREFAGGVRVQRAGGGGFGRVVDRQTDPESVRLIAHAERVADERKHEQAHRAQRENRRDRVGRILIVRIDRALWRR